MQTETGLETHGLQQDPRFVRNHEFANADIRTLDYDALSKMDYQQVVGHYDALFDVHYAGISSIFKVAASSPAIDGGTVLPPEWPDVVDITDSEPDIGCLEYVVDY
jgi:hypothetical protein